jgi:hypothetical protein
MSKALQSFLSEIKKQAGLVQFLECEPRQNENQQTSDDPEEMEFFRSIADGSLDPEDAMLASDLIGLCNAIEKYCSTVHKGHDRKGTSIIKKCPQYQARCSADGEDFHVIKIAFDLRDSLVNSTTYNVLTSVKEGPLEVIRQSVLVQESENERYVIIGSEKLNDLPSRIEQLPSRKGKKIVSLYSAFLSKEITDCIARYDATKTECAFLRPYRTLIFVQ